MLQLINELPILSILDRLGIQYRNLGSGTYGIIQDGKLTNGRKININGNYVTDFSGKGRANGSPFVFVKQKLNLTNYETFSRFKTHFNIENKNRPYRNRGSPHKQKKNSFEGYSRIRLKQ